MPRPVFQSAALLAHFGVRQFAGFRDLTSRGPIGGILEPHHAVILFRIAGPG